MNENLMIKWAKDLFYYNRSITGEGIKKTLNFFEKINPELKRLKFKSNKKVFDWKIPLEWNISDAFIQHISSGKKFAEFKKNNLHIVGYSIPKNEIIEKKRLLKNIHSLKNQPDSIPYVTSFYKKTWGFCMSEKQKKKLPNGKYRIFINSNFKRGNLEMSEALLKGKSKKEIFFSTYVCHPSMANNELSGPVVANALMKYIKETYKKSKYSYRFILLPETIGSIAYLSKSQKKLKKNMIAGFNLSCVGDERSYTQILSREGDNLADQALSTALFGKKNFKQFSFLDRGSDERQYCSPKINLPVTAFYRSKYFKEYHTDKDNFKVVSSKGLKDSLNVLKKIIDTFELGIYPVATNYCEPNLGKRNLYPTISMKRNILGHYVLNDIKIRSDILAYADGVKNIFQISKIINFPFGDILKNYKILIEKKLIKIIKR